MVSKPGVSVFGLCCFCWELRECFCYSQRPGTPETPFQFYGQYIVFPIFLGAACLCWSLPYCWSRAWKNLFPFQKGVKFSFPPFMNDQEFSKFFSRLTTSCLPCHPSIPLHVPASCFLLPEETQSTLPRHVVQSFLMLHLTPRVFLCVSTRVVLPPSFFCFGSFGLVAQRVSERP